MRPIYETTINRETEVAFAGDLARHTVLNFVRSDGELPEIDYEMRSQEGTLLGLAEIKCRTFTPGQYPTLGLSAHKWQALVDCWDRGVPGYLYVRLLEEDLMLTVGKRIEVELTTWGRTDRGDPQDVERAVMIPMDLFVRLKLPARTIPGDWSKHVLRRRKR